MTSARRLLGAADGRAVNAFESALRALALDAGLEVVPQLPVELRERTVRPDLVDVGRRLVVEADSWTYHAERSAFSRDMLRYNALVVEGWRGEAVAESGPAGHSATASPRDSCRAAPAQPASDPA